MNINDIKKQVEENYEVFDSMVLSTTMLNSAALGSYKEDAERIIDLYAEAYSVERSVTESFKSLILGDMQKIALISDYLALSSPDLISDNDYEMLDFYEIKARNIERVNIANRKNSCSYDRKSVYDNHSKMKYESFHHPYNSRIRLSQIQKQAEVGDVESIRQLGIMHYLGIGCEPDFDSAALWLSRAMIWGDIPSTLLLSKIYSGYDEARSKELSELYKIELEYLPLCDLMSVREESIENGVGVYDLFKLISYIKQFVVIREGCYDINIAFADLMLDRSILNSDKLFYILKYKDNLWREYFFNKNEHKK